MAGKQKGPWRKPPASRYQMKITLPPEDIDRLEAYCMRQSTIPPFKNLKPSTVVRFAIQHYLLLLEAEEAAVTHSKVHHPCVVASANGLHWCPKHDVRWEEGDEVPETCRGS